MAYTGHSDTAFLAAVSDQPGPGNFLRILLVVMILGAVFMAWLLLHGYRRPPGGTQAPTPDEAPRTGTDAPGGEDGSVPGQAAARSAAARTDPGTTAGPGD
ncbi:hypothetical protein [Streptomyces sp. NPDC007088]|uniref:hypothetical protein n=1 Tax=Streptomyces sp. NPDC007088 TaxID=3364773 RepID=UPI00368A8A2D